MIKKESRFCTIYQHWRRSDRNKLPTHAWEAKHSRGKNSIPFDDVVRSANSLAFIVGALVSGEFSRLKGAVNDYIHQPYRKLLNPFGHESIEAGCHVGAYTGWLSGSGSTVVCVTDEASALSVGAAMQQVYEGNGVSSRVYRLAADNKGLTVS